MIRFLMGCWNHVWKLAVAVLHWRCARMSYHSGFRSTEAPSSNRRASAQSQTPTRVLWVLYKTWPRFCLAPPVPPTSSIISGHSSIAQYPVFAKTTDCTALPLPHFKRAVVPCRDHLSSAISSSSSHSRMSCTKLSTLVSSIPSAWICIPLPHICMC